MAFRPKSALSAAAAEMRAAARIDNADNPHGGAKYHCV